MAAENGPAPEPVEDARLRFLRRVAERAKVYGVFPVLRGAEARAPDLPRIGHARRPALNVADLTQTPTMAFPDTTLDTVEAADARARIAGYYLGLTGPMGPLPLHLTEFAIYERRYSKTRPFGRFLDLLAARTLQFFYRAWADSQPAAQADRPADDQFAQYIAALSGAREGVGPTAAWPAQARLHYASAFVSHRGAAALQDALADLLRTPVRLREFQPRWRVIEPPDRSRLAAVGGFNRLGGDAVLGSRIKTVADAFRAVVRAASFRDYEAFLPTGERFKIAAEALTALKPSHLEWDLELEIEARLAPPARLDGRGRLGWTSWMMRPGTAGVRADARLRAPRLGAARGGGEYQ